ncbi:hypothetical protein M501DRAFT_974426 [Patellaria atrata CBS 101060]|uniref:Meiotic recombination protein DMC1 n=1 Tax=Patellaria atrata CBS 101060 TaxID=1346257 RepID=A0A9P4VPY2_9PEZI|nr:hypothetical protein M501DRAFT_974426 [Patellaria atrata CBS 101060]
MFSPPASSVVSSSISSHLPRPRDKPLKSGGPKESTFIRHVDQGILLIRRRFAKRETGDEFGKGAARGYDNFREASAEVEKLVDVVWVSGTPSLQVPYLLSLASLVETFIPAFPPCPKAIFRLLDKLDLAFASLIQGRDIETGDPLPGFNSVHTVTDTMKVRIKGLVGRTRITVVESMSNGDFDPEEAVDAPSESEIDTMDEDDDLEDENDDKNWQMEIAKVYERTVAELGDTLGDVQLDIEPDITDSP